MKRKPTIRLFDNVTIVVTDLEKASEFFGLFGFEEFLCVPIWGQRFSDYMELEGMEARNVILKPPRRSCPLKHEVVSRTRSISTITRILGKIDL